MDSFDKFKETQLPPQEAFFSDLTKKHIANADYNFVQNLWTTFQLKNLGELHDLYVEADTLLLADVFENTGKLSTTIMDWILCIFTQHPLSVGQQD